MFEDLSKYGTFEETAYLLLRGKLPNSKELADYKKRLASLAEVPKKVCEALELIPKDTHPMDVMRTACSFLGHIEPEEKNNEDLYWVSDSLLAKFPGFITYWYNFTHHGKRVDTSSSSDTIAAHFLRCLFGKEPSKDEAKVIDVSLILYAEHEFNASTFNARITAATLSDMYSAITGAIGTLRGPLHGGANEAAMDMLDQYNSVEDARAKVMDLLSRKIKIMGFGHAVYKEFDPRNAIIKEYSKMLAEKKGDRLLYDISCEVESIMKKEKGMFANADFFHASTYRYLGIETKLFTPIFVCSRASGWCAHVLEQRADNKLIRPGAEYTGPDMLPWLAIDKR